MQSLVDTQKTSLFLFLFYRNSLGYSRSASRKHPLKLLPVYLFKSNSLGSIHLNPLVGRNLDIA